MMQTTEWTYRFLNASTFVLGNRKNAGKTTFMNLALSHIRKVEKPAFCTIGIDGESNDMIDGRAKPIINTQPGDGIVTTYPMLQKSNGQFKIQKVFPYHTVLGQIIIATTIREGSIELVGPENNTQLNTIIKFLNTELHFKTVIIDGAASRITPIGAVNNSNCFYLVNIDRRNLSKSMDNMKMLSMCSEFEQAKDLNSSINQVYKIKGALTPSKVHSIPKEYDTIIVNNPTSIFLTHKQLKELSKKFKIQTINTYQLNGFVVVLKDIEALEFNNLYRKNNINTELIINPYVN